VDAAALVGEQMDTPVSSAGAAMDQASACSIGNSTVAFLRVYGILKSHREVARMVDRIVKVIELKATVSRVWRALSDPDEFGQWFRVKLDGPFEPGARSTGKMTYPGYEHYPWLAVVEHMEHERLLSFRWHDFDEKSGIDVAEQPATLVEFRLEPIPEGTRLTITESGFEALPDHRRLEVLRGNTEGWAIQANNIAAHVASSA
jgi:uncharacterized protein YndB with AHSA1/START domain